MPSDIVTMDDLSHAMCECESQHPIVDFCLSRDLSILAGIVGTLIFRHVNEVPRSDLTEKELSVLDKWLK